MRQQEVLERMAIGYTTQETALELGISPKTVEYHRACLMRRSGLFSVAELTRLAVRIGLAEL